MKLQLQAIEKDGIIRVAAEGAITATDFTAAGKNPLESVLGVGWPTTRAMIDMSEANYIDSSAIGWLIGSSRAFREAGGKFVIHSVQPAVSQILQLLKIGKVVQTAGDENSARKIIIGEAA